MTDQDKDLAEGLAELRARWADRIAATPSRADAAPLGDGPRSRHGGIVDEAEPAREVATAVVARRADERRGPRERAVQHRVDRSHGRLPAKETVVGYVPRAEDINLNDVGIDLATAAKVMDVDLAEWETELESQGEWFDKIGKTLPKPIQLQRDILLERVKGARKVSG